jgi:DNA-binding protein Fis
MAPNSDTLLPAHLPLEVLSTRPVDDSSHDVDLPLGEVEKRHITRVLAHLSGNRSKAARTLGISRATLYEKLHKYGLE